MSRPAMSRRRVRWGREKPSYTGQIWVTPSPESTTTPVSRPAHKQQLRIWLYLYTLYWFIFPSLKVHYLERTEWAQPGWRYKCLRTDRSQTSPTETQEGQNSQTQTSQMLFNKRVLKPRWSSLGSWWGSWAAPWAGSCSSVSRCWASRGRKCSPTSASYRPNSSRSRSPSGSSPPAWSAARSPRRPPSGPTGHTGEVKGQGTQC